MTKTRPNLVRAALASVAVVAALATCGCSAASEPPVAVVAVGNTPGAEECLRALEWAAAEVEAAGGGGPTGLVLRQVDGTDPGDADAVIVVGDSKVAYEVARQAVGRQVVMAPMATSSRLSRAFPGTGHVWRTREGDVGEVLTFFVLALESGTPRVALLAPDDPEQAWLDWFGFLATEAGLEVVEIERYADDDEACTVAAPRIVGAAPDLVLVAEEHPMAARCIVEVLRQGGLGAQVVVAGMDDPAAVLCPLAPSVADGVRILAPAWDPASGFEVAFQARFGEGPRGPGAACYDAALLLALAIRARASGGPDGLAEAVEAVVMGRDGPAGWRGDALRDTLARLDEGRRPDLAGTTGSLTFDPDRLTDVVASTHAVWGMHDGALALDELVAPDRRDLIGSGPAGAAIHAGPSDDAQQDLAGAAGLPAPPPRAGLWALLVAGSPGWDPEAGAENYRHQADALAWYQILRSRGVPDDRIVLVLADDTETIPQNPWPDQVYNVHDGPDLRAGAQVDYRPEVLGVAGLLDVLGGRASGERPAVLGSGPGDDVLIHFFSHGNETGLRMGDDWLDALLLKDALHELAEAAGFRRLLVGIEACHGGGVGPAVDVPGVLVISAANANENSLACSHDHASGIWLADCVSQAFAELASDEPGSDLLHVYEALYESAKGSHPTVYNEERFWPLSSVVLDDFLRP